jgi:dTDP-4-dehydrorhamnose reductase
MALTHTSVPTTDSNADSPPAGRRTVLVTGAAGTIGSAFAAHGRSEYDLRLMVRPADPPDRVDAVRPFGRVVVADLADLPAVKAACAGVDAVVHLAADPSPNATWDSLLPNNVVGTYHVMAAAKEAGVRRVIYASSIHAVGGYGPRAQVKTTEPPNPGDLYGVTKCFGEALGRYMAEQEGMGVIALRIGAYQPPGKMADPRLIGLADSWVSPRDLNQLFDLCVAAPDTLRWAVFHAVSDNAVNRLDVSDARAVLGYAPRDDAFAVVPGLAELGLRGKLMNHNMADPWAKSGLRDDVSRKDVLRADESREDV